MKIARILVRSILALGLAGALYLIACIIINPAGAAEAKTLTTGDALSMLQALRNLDGRTVLVKQNGVDAPVTMPWEFGSGTLRLRIVRNVAALSAVEKNVEEARVAIVKELLKSIPVGKDGKPATAIPPESSEFARFQEQYAELMKAPAQVTLDRIRASELKLDKNEIPITTLAALGPILDDDSAQAPKP